MYIRPIVGISIISVLVFLLFPSCVDKEYDWDELDRNGVVNIPDLPLGCFDTIFVDELLDLDEIPGGEIPTPGKFVVKEYILENMFGGDAIKYFFFDGAGNVELSALTDIDISSEDLDITVHYTVLDSQRKIIDDIKIPLGKFTNGDNQPLLIQFGAEYIKYMKDTKHLRMCIVIQADEVRIKEGDFIYIKESRLHTGGIHIEL